MFWGYLKTRCSQQELRRSTLWSEVSSLFVLGGGWPIWIAPRQTVSSQYRQPRDSYLFSEYKSQTQLLHCTGLMMFTLLLHQLTFSFRIIDSQRWKESESFSSPTACLMHEWRLHNSLSLSSCLCLTTAVTGSSLLREAANCKDRFKNWATNCLSAYSSPWIYTVKADTPVSEQSCKY